MRHTALRPSETPCRAAERASPCAGCSARSRRSSPPARQSAPLCAVRRTSLEALPARAESEGDPARRKRPSQDRRLPARRLRREWIHRRSGQGRFRRNRRHRRERRATARIGAALDSARRTIKRALKDVQFSFIRHTHCESNPYLHIKR